MLAAVAAATLAALLAAPAVAQPAGNPQLDRVRAERERLGQQVDDVTLQLEQLSVAITDAQTERDRLQSDVDALQEMALGAQRLVRAQAVQTYMYGDFGPVGELLTAVQPGEALERSRMLAGLSLREREMVERAVLARAALASRRSELNRVLGQLQQDEARVAALRAELHAAFAQAKSAEVTLASLSARQRLLSRPGQRGV